MKVFFRNIKSNFATTSTAARNLYFCDQNGIVRVIGEANTFGELGNNTTSGLTQITPTPYSLAGGRVYSEIAAGVDAVLALEEGTGTLYSWGRNDRGQLGDGTLDRRSSPVSVLGDIRFRSIFIGGQASGTAIGGLDLNGNAWLWGHNDIDFSVPPELRAPETYSPRKIITDTSFSQVFTTAAVGVNNQAVALEASTGKIWAWGNNLGTLGNNTTSSYIESPSTIGDTSYIKIEKRSAQTYALDPNGTLWTFGRVFGRGELGNGTVLNGTASSPVSVLSARSFSNFYSFDNYNAYLSTFNINTNCFAIDSDGYAWAWGFNSGALGDGTTANASTPVSVSTDKKFSIIQGSLVLDIGGSNNRVVFAAIDSSTGHIYTWGQAQSGALGDNSTSFRSAPVSVHSGGRSFTQVAVAPSANVVALDGDGYAWSWGSGSNGLNGNGSVANRSTPVSVFGNRQFKQVVHAGTFVVALESSTGLAYSWGSNTSGQLADGTAASKSTPVSVVGGRSYSFITVSGDQINPAIHLISDGQIFAWGNNSNGRLGDGTVLTRSSPVSVLSSRSFSSVSADWNTSGVVNAIEASTGHVWTWGTQLVAGLGRGATNFSTSPRKLEGYKFKKLVFAEGSTTPTAYGLTDAGELYSWGVSTTGLLGNNVTSSVLSPLSISGTWSDVVASDVNAFAIERSTGRIWGWGNGTTIGNNQGVNRSSPVLIATSISFSKVVTSTNAVAAALEASTGFVYSWGVNNGRMGDGTTINRSSPVSVVGGRSYSNIFGLNNALLLVEGSTNNLYFTGSLSSLGFPPNPVPLASIEDGGGKSYTSLVGAFKSAQKPIFALDSSGNVWGWGTNSAAGILGVNTTFIECDTPAMLPGGILFKSIHAGGNRNCGIEASTGNIYGWGQNPVGDNTNAARSTPTLVAGGRSYSYVCSVDNHTLAIEASSRLLYSWGNSTNGMLASNSSLTRSSPITVAGLRSYSTVRFLGESNAVALESNTGLAWMWGLNGNGQLGDGTVTTRSSPVSVLGGRSFVDITGSKITNATTIALDGMGQVISWGYNTHGNLGDGTTNNRSTPVTVLGTRSYSLIRMGPTAGNSNVGVALEGSTGMAYCWGGDPARIGFLGDGTTVSRISSPVAVLGDRSYKDIQVGHEAIYALEASTGNIYWWGNRTVTNTLSPTLFIQGKSFSSLMNANDHINLVTNPANANNNFGAIEGSTGKVYMWGARANIIGNSAYRPYFRSPTAISELKVENINIASAFGVDRVGPTVGTGITFDNVTYTSIRINWGPATDNFAPQSALQYKVMRASSAALLSTISSALSQTQVMDWTANATSVTDTGLTLNTTYYYAVIVRDSFNNSSLYVAQGQATNADVTPPTVGGAIDYLVGSTQMVLSWPASTDDGYPQNTLQYKPVYSLSDNISTASDAEVNGSNITNAFGSPVFYTTNLTNVETWSQGLNPNTTYYTNVLVRDGSLNAAVYSRVSVQTISPTYGFDFLDSSNYRVKWNASTSSSTPQNQLEYKLMYIVQSNWSNGGYSTRPLSDWEAAFTVAMDWTTNVLVSPTLPRPAPASYVFAILARDSSGKKVVNGLFAANLS